MSTRKTIAAVLAIAAVGLVAVWLYAIAASTGQLRALSLPADTGSGAAPSSEPPRVVNRPPPPPVDLPPDQPLIVQESADAPAAADPRSAGPISGASFAELLEGGLAGEENDPVASEELRNALREAAADSAEPE